MVPQEDATDREGDEKQGSVSGISTAASGPAGAHFEQEVAAFYLLAMLAGAPPRGMPGARIERVMLQQANAGNPLDDVILALTDTDGQTATLEIQVKRTIPFSPQDKIFAKVVAQIADTARQPRFANSVVEMAVAASRSSRNIDGAYQDVLAVARQVRGGPEFAAHIQTPGSGNPQMRQFVETFKANLAEHQAPSDDEHVWRMLRRLQILIFDFEAPGSVSRDLARERCRAALEPEDIGKADALWAGLTEIAFEAAKRGGGHDRSSLLNALQPLGLRLAGERRNARSRLAIAESTRQCLSDIKVHVGSVRLSRRHWIDQVRTALGQGRYVEIRGEPGVGKSGVLRGVAELMQREGQVIAIDPSRCIPRGGVEYCSRIGFKGGARELLSELAADGGAILFFDNLDFYGEENRSTVIDLIRAAAQLTAVSVITTARPGFGVDDADWLPKDSIDVLGRSTPVRIDALAQDELTELRARAPELAALLAPGHPAQKISGNLFRLSRLVQRGASAATLRTEVDLAEQWWTLADGVRDNSLRDRMRLLVALGLHAVSHGGAFDCSAFPAPAVDTLRGSGTLRELSPDKVDFQHDVLREWAIAFSLDVDPALVAALPLEKPASAALSRGIELAARLSLERSADEAKWRALLHAVSQPGAHRSWRRFVLLAVFRSEAVDALLIRTRPTLLAEGGELLRELASSVATVEVVRLIDVLDAKTVAAHKLTPHHPVPKGQGWHVVIAWLLGLGRSMPAVAVLGVVRMFQVYAFGIFTNGFLAVEIATQLGRWLRDFEPDAADHKDLRPGDTSPSVIDWGQLKPELARALRQDLRETFALLATKAPEPAKAYVRAVIDMLGSNAQLAKELVLRPFNLTQAAPQEIAELTLKTLTGGRGRGRRRRALHDEFDEAFSYIDSQFLPMSPAHGVFFALLNVDPQTGLDLVRKLVTHAVEWAGSVDGEAGSAVALRLDGAERSFPYTWAYGWSRKSNFYAMTSALQALEAWAHRRLDAGEEVQAVLTEVLGPPGTSAAFVLIAVDLMISHWPRTQDCALPFLSSPELMALDIKRVVRDQLAHVDPFPMDKILGIQMPGEPIGAVSSAELSKRISRDHDLLSLVPKFTADPATEQAQQLVAALQAAAELLGPYKAHHTLEDPAFMARHALNQANPANWQDIKVRLKDDRIVDARSYVSPPDEDAHFCALRSKHAQGSSDLDMTMQLSMALSSGKSPTVEVRAAAVQWAQAPERNAEISKEQRIAVLTAALLVLRDAPDAERELHADWAVSQCDAVLLDPKPDHVLQGREGLAYNPLAIAFAARLRSLAWRSSTDDLRAVISVAARGIHEAAHGLRDAIETVIGVDDRIVKSMIRLALRACTQSRTSWDATPEEKDALKVEQEQNASYALEAELQWLGGASAEPSWPTLPRKEPRFRQRLRVPGGQANATLDMIDSATSVGTTETPGDVSGAAARMAPAVNNTEVEADAGLQGRDPPVFNHHSAALWLRQPFGAGLQRLDWLMDFAAGLMSWTMTANGAELPDREEASNAPREWNEVFLAYAVQGLPADDLAVWLNWVAPLLELHDRNFFALADSFLSALDQSYFGPNRHPATSVAAGVRSALADHLCTTWGWKRAQRQEDGFIELHLSYVIARLFFNGRSGLNGLQCLLTPFGMERLGDFLPCLERLVAAGPCRKVAEVLFNLLEIAPKPEHLPVLVIAGQTWWEAFKASQVFWVEAGAGMRWCRLVITLVGEYPDCVDAKTGMALAHLAANLVATGVAEAPYLEAALPSATG